MAWVVRKATVWQKSLRVHTVELQRETAVQKGYFWALPFSLPILPFVGKTFLERFPSTVR